MWDLWWTKWHWKRYYPSVKFDSVLGKALAMLYTCNNEVPRSYLGQAIVSIRNWMFCSRGSVVPSSTQPPQQRHFKSLSTYHPRKTYLLPNGRYVPTGVLHCYTPCTLLKTAHYHFVPQHFAHACTNCTTYSDSALFLERPRVRRVFLISFCGLPRWTNSTKGNSTEDILLDNDSQSTVDEKGCQPWLESK